jgi:hypothetical protein
MILSFKVLALAVCPGLLSGALLAQTKTPVAATPATVATTPTLAIKLPSATELLVSKSFSVPVGAPAPDVVCILNANAEFFKSHRCQVTAGGSDPCGPQICTSTTTTNSDGSTSTVVNCDDPSQACAQSDNPQGPTAQTIGGDTCQNLQQGLDMGCAGLTGTELQRCQYAACVEGQECAGQAVSSCGKPPSGGSSTGTAGGTATGTGSSTGSSSGLNSCQLQFASDYGYCLQQTSVEAQRTCIATADYGLGQCTKNAVAAAAKQKIPVTYHPQ